MTFLYRTIFLCTFLILIRNGVLFLDKNFADQSILPPPELRYYHVNHSALCADGVTMYGKCSQKSDK